MNFSATPSVDIITTITTITTAANTSWMVDGARAVISRKFRRWTRQQVSGSLLRGHHVGLPRASAPTTAAPIFATLYFPIKVFATPSIDTSSSGIDAGAARTSKAPGTRTSTR